MKPKIGKQRTATGAYSSNFDEKCDSPVPNMGGDLVKIDKQEWTDGFTGPAPKGK